MLPVIAIVGRPNVGKSTLFNQLTRSRDALVGDMRGVTRDRQYGHGKRHETPHLLIDTGGLFLQDTYHSLVESQVATALGDASHIFFVVDAKAGLMPEDYEIAKQLRVLDKPLYLLVNKIDAGDENCMTAEFHQLGMTKVFPISAEHNRGIQQLIESVLENIKVETPEESPDAQAGIRVAIIGKPNVGKSTLTNRILGEDRMVVYDQPGTTVDSIESHFERFGKKYILIDTAGVRKKANIKEKIEKFSIVKTMQAVQNSHVVLMVLDAREGLGEQDLKLLQYSIEAGKAIILCLNKWDNLDFELKDKVKQQIAQRLRFAEYIKVQTLSALHGTNVGLLYTLIDKAYKAASAQATTAQLTDWLYQAQMKTLPPLVQGRRIKLRFAHMGGQFPPTIVIHGSQAEKVPAHYQRYLMHYFMKMLRLHSTPLKLVFKTTENPYKDRPNELNLKQRNKRNRIIKHRIDKAKRKKAKMK